MTSYEMSTPEKIVIVDDELSIRMHLQTMLAKKGYASETLGSGKELIEQIEKIQPDLIIMDVIMPEMDGFEVCRRLKESKWQYIPIILATVLDAKTVLSRSAEVGADDYLQKPVNKLELQARVRSMLRIKRQYDELNAIMYMREELSNMIIHDMSSPITSVLLHATLLGEKVKDLESREHLDMICMAANRLDSFVNDMLMMAKMEQSTLRINSVPVDICLLARDVEKQFSIIAQSRGITLRVNLPEESIEKPLDGHLFRRVIGNLLANALQYAPAGSTVTLQVESIWDGFRLLVMDEGPGIPAADRDRVFKKFEVVKLKKKGIRQIGLGLAFCKMVVDAHDGNIYVNANSPQGSIFVVEI
ncbi:MAG: hybrid sensor histidine kinase/response regulator [Gammaproteobacteria bacterium]|nr:hybrid sensor histidine kinase/response regulator [Gammaproteobacteria bacterium]